MLTISGRNKTFLILKIQTYLLLVSTARWNYWRQFASGFTRYISITRSLLKIWVPANVCSSNTHLIFPFGTNLTFNFTHSIVLSTRAIHNIVGHNIVETTKISLLLIYDIGQTQFAWNSCATVANLTNDCHIRGASTDDHGFSLLVHDLSCLVPNNDSADHDTTTSQYRSNLGQLKKI